MKKTKPIKDKRTQSQKDEEFIRNAAAVRGITYEQYMKELNKETEHGHYHRSSSSSKDH